MSNSVRPKVKGVADIVFLIDSTGSMGTCINAVKDNIAKFVKTLTTPTANGASVVKDWRAKVVGYRDLEYDDHPAHIDNPFVGTVDALEKQLGTLHAAGGGDEPETLLESLYKVAMMPTTTGEEQLRPDAWRPQGQARRFVVVFTDAPFKEPLLAPEGATIDDLILNLMTSKVILHIFAPKMFKRYDTLAEVDKSFWHAIDCNSKSAQLALADYVSDGDKFGKILETLARTITVEAATPMVLSLGRGDTLVDESAPF